MCALSWERITLSSYFYFSFQIFLTRFRVDCVFYKKKTQVWVNIFNKNKTSLMINWAWASTAVSTPADVIHFNFHNRINHQWKGKEKELCLLILGRKIVKGCWKKVFVKTKEFRGKKLPFCMLRVRLRLWMNEKNLKPKPTRKIRREKKENLREEILELRNLREFSNVEFSIFTFFALSKINLRILHRKISQISFVENSQNHFKTEF